MFDDEIENVLERMVDEGLVRKFEQNGETLYQITKEGESALREMKRVASHTPSTDLN